MSKRRVVNRTSSYRRPNPRVARSGSRSKKKPFIGRGLKIVIVVVLLIAIGISGSILYYNHSIEAPDKNSKTTKQVKIILTDIDYCEVGSRFWPFDRRNV